MPAVPRAASSEDVAARFSAPCSAYARPREGCAWQWAAGRVAVPMGNGIGASGTVVSRRRTTRTGRVPSKSKHRNRRTRLPAADADAKDGNSHRRSSASGPDGGLQEFRRPRGDARYRRIERRREVLSCPVQIGAVHNLLRFRGPGHPRPCGRTASGARRPVPVRVSARAVALFALAFRVRRSWPS